MSDLSDLHGSFPTPLRWQAERGELGVQIWNSALGERELNPIRLGTNQAKFALDFATRERGYGMIRIGAYDMRLTPVGSNPPPWPNDPDYKKALGCWVWNPDFGELRLETNAAMLVRTIDELWDRIRTFKEASQGLQPVILFLDKRPVTIQSLGRTFYSPVIDVVGWIAREKIPVFARRNPTVATPGMLPGMEKPQEISQEMPLPGERGKIVPPPGQSTSRILEEATTRRAAPPPQREPELSEEDPRHWNPIEDMSTPRHWNSPEDTSNDVPDMPVDWDDRAGPPAGGDRDPVAQPVDRPKTGNSGAAAPTTKPLSEEEYERWRVFEEEISANYGTLDAKDIAEMRIALAGHEFSKAAPLLYESTLRKLEAHEMRLNRQSQTV
ncbi:MAG: hypothetical protein J2P48_19685 [Alphaproteobacteria bacterium]|nr:hypothetical protein [Alphaproteobacteria bacterium]